MSDITIKKERILKAADVSPEAKRTLKTLFPEVFKDNYFRFDEDTVIDSVGPDSINPLYIGLGCAKPGDAEKVLIVSDNFEVEVIPQYYQKQIGLKFKRK